MNLESPISKDPQKGTTFLDTNLLQTWLDAIRKALLQPRFKKWYIVKVHRFSPTTGRHFDTKYRVLEIIGFVFPVTPDLKKYPELQELFDTEHEARDTLNECAWEEYCEVVPLQGPQLKDPTA
jgi:hypothetical protein